MRRPGRLFAVLTVVVPVASLFAQATDPIIRGMIGTWELNLAQSKYRPGRPPKSEIRTYEVAGKGVKFTSRGLDAEGRPLAQLQYTANYDGRDYPIIGSRDVDTIALRRIDAYTTEATLKRGGQAVATATRAISVNGRILTFTTKGTNAAGQTIDNILVFEKR